MSLRDFLNKHVLITLKDGKKVEGIITDILNYENDEESLFYTQLQVRVDADDYRNIYIGEIDKIGEII